MNCRAITYLAKQNKNSIKEKEAYRITNYIYFQATVDLRIPRMRQVFIRFRIVLTENGHDGAQLARLAVSEWGG